MSVEPEGQCISVPPRDSDRPFEVFYSLLKAFYFKIVQGIFRPILEVHQEDRAIHRDNSSGTY